jgi:uncharacterized protein
MRIDPEGKQEAYQVLKGECRMVTAEKNQAEVKILPISIILGIAGMTAYAASKLTPGYSIVIIAAAGLVGCLVTQVFLAVRLKKFKRTVRDIFLSMLAVGIGAYAFLFVFVYFFQDKVANETASFFQPKAISAEAVQALDLSNVAAIDLAAPDGVHLRGWLVSNSAEAQAPLIIYFGGSGSDSSEMISYVKKLAGWSIALINYRGFGQSEGTPSQANVLADALFLYDAFTKRADIDASRVVVMGYSLGTGVAVSLAAQRPVAATILVSPYDHWSLIGVNNSPVFIPLAGIMKPYFNSISLAPGIQGPLLCLIGTQDTFIPPALSHNLSSAWGGKTVVVEYPGEDHRLLFHSNSSWKDIADFLARI